MDTVGWQAAVYNSAGSKRPGHFTYTHYVDPANGRTLCGKCVPSDFDVMSISKKGKGWCRQCLAAKRKRAKQC